MSFDILDLGKYSYKQAITKQDEIRDELLKGKLQDTLIFVEHEPVYTLGKNANENNIHADYPKEVKIYNIDRGGDVTYHGPGQIVGYPIINIKKRGMSIGRYVHTLENIIINTLQHFGIIAEIREKLIGVWVGDEKIAAIGVRVKDGITKHGLALNVNTDLSYFDGIIPCGITDCKVTSINKVLQKDIDMEIVQTEIVKQFKKYF